MAAYKSYLVSREESNCITWFNIVVLQPINVSVIFDISEMLSQRLYLRNQTRLQWNGSFSSLRDTILIILAVCLAFNIMNDFNFDFNFNCQKYLPNQIYCNLFI